MSEKRSHAKFVDDPMDAGGVPLAEEPRRNSLSDDAEEDFTGDPSPFVCLPFYGEHKRAVSSVQLAPSKLTPPNAPRCASASSDGTIKIWDLSMSSVSSASANNNNNSAQSGTEASNFVGGSALTPTLYDHPATTAPPHSNDPGSTASTTPAGNTNVNGKEEFAMTPLNTLLGHSRGINEVCWSTGGDPFLATASDDKTLRVWDALTGDALVEFRGHDNFVFCCQFNRPSNLLVSGSFDETVKLWDVRSGECVCTLPAHSDPVTAVAFNRDGSCVVSASHDGLIRIWDVCTGECLKTIFAAGNPPVSHVTYSPNGKFVLAGTLDSSLRLWPVSVSGKSKCAKTYTSEFHANSKYCIGSKFLVSKPKQRQCIVTGSETGHVLLYDIQSRRVHQLLEQVHKDAVLAVDAHDQLELLASGGMSKDRTVRFWAPKDQQDHHHRPYAAPQVDSASAKRPRTRDEGLP